MADANSVTAALGTLGAAGWLVNDGPSSPYKGGVGSGIDPALKKRLDNEGVSLAVPAATAVYRWSTNTAGDATNQTMATFTVPEGLLRVGSIIEPFAHWRISNSASVKTLEYFINGVSLFALVKTTIDYWVDAWRLEVYSTTVLLFGNTTITVSDLTTNPLVLTFVCRWGAAASGEYIQLMHGKINLTP